MRPPQLSNGSALAEYDPFGMPDAGAQQPDDSPMQLFLKVHRMLRGRYRLAILLSAIGAAIGAAVGYLSTERKWQSSGAIRVEYMGKVGLGMTENTLLPMFDSYVRDQIAYLEQDETVSRAMLSEEWRKFDRGVNPEAKRQFRKSLNVNVDRDNRQWIKVRFVDKEPEAARAAVRNLIDSYKVLFGDKILLSNEQTIALLQRERLRYEGDIKALNNKIAELGNKFGTTDLGNQHDQVLKDRRAAEEKIQELDAQIRHAKAMAAATNENPAEPGKQAARPLGSLEEAMEIAKFDPSMNRLVLVREQAYGAQVRAERKFTPGSPQLQDAVAAVADVDRQIKERRDQWMAAHNNMLPRLDTPGTGIILTAPVEVLEETRKHYQNQFDQKNEEARVINLIRNEIGQLQTEIRTKNDELVRVRERLNLLSLDSAAQDTESSAIGRVQIISDGEEPSLYSDSRKKLAALGFLMGGSLPVIAVMLLGSLDRRFRYSDDAQTGASKVPLLGILPYLPDTMIDPEQAGIAAHCVHQIRTLLQIGGVEHDRRVFAITSATSGDGKTSLSVSLGLSFAASGSNTCLIDFDMIGGGLTAAMGARTDVGLLAAIDDGQLDGHIRATAFPRLSLIPAGRDDAQEISRLSPKLVRRLIEQARKQFDVVIIDTGPILGSIEATLVCGVVDGVVLALGRGQQRSMATRAVNTLRGVGAHIMGVVFNRAQSHDFKRTVSQSVRSIPMHDSDGSVALKALPGMGPMARTVVSHTRSDS